MPNEPDVLTYEEAAKELKVGDSIVRTLLRRKRIKVLDLGYRTKRITRRALEEFKVTQQR